MVIALALIELGIVTLTLANLRVKVCLGYICNHYFCLFLLMLILDILWQPHHVLPLGFRLLHCIFTQNALKSILKLEHWLTDLAKVSNLCDLVVLISGQLLIGDLVVTHALSWVLFPFKIPKLLVENLLVDNIFSGI